MADIIFHPDTAHEIKSSYEWYQNQAKGLGEDFVLMMLGVCEIIIGLKSGE